MPRGCGYLYGAVFFILEIMIYKITTPLDIDLEFKNDYDFSLIEVSITPQHKSVEFKKTKFILDASQLDDLIYIFSELKKKQNERVD